MRRLILLFLTLTILSACSNKYHRLGYKNNEVSIINSLSEDNQVFFDEYDENLAKILTSKNFNEDNLDTYILFSKFIDGERIVDLVNDEVISKSNYAVIKRLTSNDDFNIDYLNEYLDKYKTIKDTDTVIKLVNEDIKGDNSLISELVKDKYYIANNLDKYIKYYSKDKTIRENVEYVNTLNYLTYFEDNFYAEPDIYGVLVQVNKFYYLGESYNPKDLVELGNYGLGQLRKIAYDAYVNMREAARKDGMSFYVTSAYRSYEKQVDLYNNYLQIDKQEDVDIYSARPGFSDHQSGYTVDILQEGSDFDTFYKTDASEWLKENAYKYGFICRYPEGKQDITGYEYEPWHYRYVGVYTATYIHNTGITYDEYYECFVKKW